MSIKQLRSLFVSVVLTITFPAHASNGVVLYNASCMAQLSEQVAYLFLLALPVACISWTITHEEVFREIIDYCRDKSKTCVTIPQRKFFYLFTCEYCFSHYVVIALLFITQYHLIYSNWRGYLIGGFAMVWIANIYMSIYGFIRQCLKKEKMEAYLEEEILKQKQHETEAEENKINESGRH